MNRVLTASALFLVFPFAAFLQALTPSSSGPIDAAIINSMIGNVAPGVDSVAAGTTITSPRYWDIGMYTWNTSSTFTNPTITVNNDVRSSISGNFYVQPPGGSPTFTPGTTNLPYTISLSNMPDHASFTIGWSPSDVIDTFTPGFDSSRTVSPAVLPAGPGYSNQTVTVKMKAVDSRYAPSPSILFTQMWVGIGGNCQSISPAILGGNASCTPGDNGGAAWNFFSPVVGAEYTFTAVITVYNPHTYPVTAKPWISVKMNVGYNSDVVYGSGTSVTEPTLGTVNYSVSESNVEWHPHPIPDQNYALNYPLVMSNDFGNLCSLTQQLVSQHGVANSLCAKLDAAAAAAARGNLTAEAGALGAYVNEVNAQTNKFITVANAAILLQIAGTL